jgi:ribose-phosphate pyrophosphokinase
VSVRDRDVYVVQSLAATAEGPVGDRLVRLLFLLAGLRDAGARRRAAIVPYLAFARKDRRTQPRDPVNTRYVAELLEAIGLDRLIALDVHNPAALDNAFRIPVDHLSALPMMADHFARRLQGEPLAVASPDVGGIKRAQLFREQLQRRLGRDVEFVFVEKRRSGSTVSGGAIVGAVAERTVIVLDDLCATGGTLLRAAEACRGAGARAVHVAVTHAPMAEGIAIVAESANVDGILCTDSAAQPLEAATGSGTNKLTVLPIAPLFGAALRRVLAHQPLAPLLETWPPPPET